MKHVRLAREPREVVHMLHRLRPLLAAALLAWFAVGGNASASTSTLPGKPPHEILLVEGQPVTCAPGMVYLLDEEGNLVCIQSIGMTASPNPTPPGGTVSFFTSCNAETDGWDNLGHSWWNSISFSQVVNSSFTWTAYCSLGGIQSSSLHIVVDSGGCAGCGGGGGVGGGAVPALIAAPTVGGTAAVGQTLTADRGSWTNSPTSYRYSWKRHGDLLELGTGPSLALSSSHAGYQIRVDVQACNGTGCSSWASSSWTEPVDPFPGGWFYEDSAAESTETRTLQGVGRMSCKTVHYKKTARSFLFRTVLFRMHHDLRWCWKGKEILEASAVCYSSDLDVAIQAGTCSTPQGQYFATSTHLRGGWHSIAENTYRNCLPIFGGLTCWRQRTVALHIYAYAGGAWVGQGGDS